MFFLENIIAYVKQEDLSGVLLTGIDNFTYVTGISLPYPKNDPDRSTAILIRNDAITSVIIPKEYEEVMKDQGWDKEIIAYVDGVPPEIFLSELTSLLQSTFPKNCRVGIDKDHVTVRVFQQLQIQCSQIEWIPVDNFLINSRSVKNQFEISLLEKAARYAELGIVSALNHLEGMLEPVSFTIQETAERMRVHVGEFGGSATGHVAASQGMDTQFLFVPPHGQIREGNLLRYDLSCCYHNYWAVSSRTAYTGENPPPEYIKAYRDNLTLKNAAVSSLSPGKQARDIFNAVVKKSKDCNIPFEMDYGVGHGVGVSEREDPHLVAENDTLLKIGMVVVVDVISYGPNKELIRNSDTYVLEDTTSRLLSWYRNYNKLYTIYGSTAVHG